MKKTKEDKKDEFSHKRPEVNESRVKKKKALDPESCKDNFSSNFDLSDSLGMDSILESEIKSRKEKDILRDE